MKRKGHERIGGGERRIEKGKRRRTGQRTGQRGGRQKYKNPLHPH